MERGGGITKNVVREILNHRLCSLHPHIIQVWLCSHFHSRPRRDAVQVARQRQGVSFEARVFV